MEWYTFVHMNFCTHRFEFGFGLYVYVKPTILISHQNNKKLYTRITTYTRLFHTTIQNITNVCIENNTEILCDTQNILVI